MSDLSSNKEFLPLCDVLFNLISLAWYFCNVVFDIVTSYAFYKEGQLAWCFLSLSFVFFSILVNQLVSLKCSFKSLHKRLENKEPEEKETSYLYNKYLIIIVHASGLGVLWRYVKLFVPVDLRFVKHEVRDLCLLRLIHAFCESAPLLLIQLYLLFKETEPKELQELLLVSSVISLFSVCWALASFSKNIRQQNVHRLVFTWLGVIFQLLWRLGTVGSRVCVLILYATLYGEWLFLVLGFHWVSMFLWLISPKNVFYGERLSKRKKALLAALIAFIYTFAYINLQQVNHRSKMVIFYVVMFLENNLLLAVWLVGVWPQYKILVPLLIIFAFLIGLCFMGLYYRIFHVRRLTYWSGQYCNCRGSCECNGSNSSTTRLANKTSSEIRSKQLNDNINKLLHCASQSLANGRYHSKIPGVFNCRFSSPYANAAKRKKKKPTTFVPPPSVVNNNNNTKGDFLEEPIVNPVAFWKQPLPNSQGGGSSENENSSVGSRVNIQHKLQEKKQKQLAELRVIQEEIKQGKLQQPAMMVSDTAHAPPVPRTKRHVESLMWGPPLPLQSSIRGFSYQLLPPPSNRWQQKRADTPEILLAPHFLENNRWGKFNNPNHYDECSSGHESTCDVYKSYRAASDLESQISLPRSFTLPREFKYYKAKKPPPRSDNYLRSNNSSDGDVDSGDEGGESTPQNSPIPRQRVRNFYHHRQVRHETKL